MDLYNLVAQWTGWPIIVAILLLAGGYAIWFLNSRLEYQKEINQKMAKDLSELQKTSVSVPDESIVYRAVIRLIHDRTGVCLHSHNRMYEHPGSSKQQQVTGFAGSNDDDFWIVKGPHNFPEEYKKGNSIRHGDIIRLEHRTTRKNLHSHSNTPSPVSGQQEVTAFGEDGVGDTNDNWKVDIENGGVWLQGVKVRLIHQNTGAMLHSHAGYNLPEIGYHQQEVTCFERRNLDDWWRAAIFQEPILYTHAG